MIGHLQMEGLLAVKEKVTQARKFTAQLAEDVQEKEVEWLWRPYIPRGMLTLLEGDPGLGKSWISLAIATALSKGGGLPGMPEMIPQKTLICNSEDSPEYSIVPRLKKMGADLSQVYLYGDMLGLVRDGALNELEEFMRDVAATVLFIDPIVAHIGGVDMHRANEVRPIMARLADLAERTGSAIICVRHLRKGGDGTGSKLHAGLGSIDFAAAARSILQVGTSKGGDAVIYHIKSNIAKKGPGISYTITDNGFQWGAILNEHEFSGVCKTPRARERSRLWLKEILADGELPAGQIEEMAALKGLSPSTLQRAKEGIAESIQTADGWVWRLLDKP